MNVVLLAHGSPDQRSGAAVRAAARLVRQRTGRAVVAAFLDHDSPRLDDALAGLDARLPVSVLPLLLSEGYHADVDVAEQVGRLAPGAHLLPALGHPAALLEPLLSSTRTTVLVAAGSRRTQAVNAFERAVADATARTGCPARAAFVTGAGPRLSQVAQAGDLVLPFLLAPGTLLDRALADAAALDVELDPRALLDRSEVLDVLASAAAQGGVESEGGLDQPGMGVALGVVAESAAGKRVDHLGEQAGAPRRGHHRGEQVLGVV